MQNITSIDDFASRLVSMTDLRRNAGEIFDRLTQVGSFLVLKDGKPVGKIVPAEEAISPEDIKANVAKVKKLAGGLKLDFGTPEELNDIIEKEYEEVLPR